MALLLVAGALTFMAYALQSPRDKNNAILAAALLIVVTLTCVMSYFQERSASNVMGEPGWLPVGVKVDASPPRAWPDMAWAHTSTHARAAAACVHCAAAALGAPWRFFTCPPAHLHLCVCVCLAPLARAHPLSQRSNCLPPP